MLLKSYKRKIVREDCPPMGDTNRAKPHRYLAKFNLETYYDG